MKSYNRLTQLLDEEIATYRELLVVKEKEYRCTQVSDLRGVQACNQQLETLLREAQTLEAQRSTLVEDLVVELGQADTPRTVSGLAALLPQPYREHVTWQARQLRQIVGQLCAVNERNSKLLRAAVDFITETINWLLRSVHRQPVYAANGMRTSILTGPELVDQQV